MLDIAGETALKVTNTKLYVLLVTLSTEDNVKPTKQLNEGFKRPAYWNEYQTKIESKEEEDNLTIFYLGFSFQGVKILFVLAFDNTDYGYKNVEWNGHRIYLLPKVNITKQNVLIGGRNCYDHAINDQINRKFVDDKHFKDHY